MTDKLELISKARTVTLLRGYVVELAEQVDELSKKVNMSDNVEEELTQISEMATMIREDAVAITDNLEALEKHSRVIDAILNMPWWAKKFLGLKI